MASFGLKLPPREAKALQAMIDRWSKDPVAFVLEVFGPGYEKETGKPLELDGWQRNFLRALVGKKRRIAAKACKGPGKTAVLAWVGWWFLLTRNRPKGAAMSITGDNLDDGLWAELSLWQQRSPLLVKLFEHKAESIEARGLAEDGETPLGKNWFLSKRTFRQDADKTQQADTVAGIHADSVFLLLDEIGSYPPGVMSAANAIFNVKGVDALIAAAGNPTDMDGPLYEICTDLLDIWHVEEINGDPDDPNHSTRIDLDEARREILKKGRNDPVVMVNYLGKFPPRGSTKLLGPDDITAAVKRAHKPHVYDRQPIVWGLDVAAEGLDSSKLYKRQGPVVLEEPKTWNGLPTDDLANQVAFEYHQDRKKGRAPKKIFVDKGGVGYGTFCNLRTLLGKEIVVGVDFGSNAQDEEQYEDRRTEMWCRMADWIKDVGCIPHVAELRRDLTAPNIGTASNTSKGTRRKLESKKDMKKRGLPSPDDGDGLGLTFAAEVLSDQMEQLVGQHRGRVETSFDWQKSIGG
jgi:phage terminase large subunit